MKPAQPIIRVTERPNDFGRYRGAVVYAGTCCTCCCLWAITGALGGVSSALIASHHQAYREIPKRIRHRFGLGAVIGFAIGPVLMACCMIIASTVPPNISLPRTFGVLIFWTLVFLPTFFLPAGIGGLIAAGRARRRLRNDPSANAGAPVPSLWPLWRLTLFMWLGTFVGTVIGVAAVALRLKWLA